MKILFDNIIYSLQRSGGGSVYWSELIKRFNKTEDDTIFYDHENFQQNIFRQDLRLKNVKKEVAFNLKIRRYLPFTEKIPEKSIFHSSYYRYSNSKNAINITSVHDFTTELFRKGLPKWIHYYQKKIALQKSDGIICISENTKKDLLKFHPNIDENKIKVIYNGVSNDFFRINTTIDLEKINITFRKNYDKKFIIFIGHRTSYKNFDLAVKAYALLKNSTYHFLIIGEKLNISETKLLNEYLEKESYTLLNGINNEQLNLIYNSAFVLVYPSSYEGFGIPLLEAMKTGLPVISSNNSSLPEVSGNAGLVLNDMSPEKIAESIISLNNVDFRKKIIENGFVQAKKFNWDKTFEQYYQFYKELYDAR